MVSNLLSSSKHSTLYAPSCAVRVYQITPPVNDIEAAYISVKQVTDSLTRSAIKAFDNDRTVLIYNEDPSKSVSKTLPFITFNILWGIVGSEDS